MEQEQRKIYFLTDREGFHQPLVYTSTKITVTKESCLLDQWFVNRRFASLDAEFNGSRFYVNQLLLLQIGDEYTQFVIDCGSQKVWNECKDIINKYAEQIVFFGHNLKGDRNQLYCEQVYLNKVFDIMTAEQRIHLGKGFETEANLASMTHRYLNKFRDKVEQTSFLKMNRNSKLNIMQIIYAADDVVDILPIARLQRTILQSYGQYDWFCRVENELTIVLAEMEVEGIKCYPKVWQGIIEKTKIDIKVQEKKLNEEVVKHYKEDKPQLVVENLFGETTLLENHKKAINFNSPDQIMTIIQRVDGRVPMHKEKGEAPKPSARETAIMQYLIDYPSTKLRTFFDEYLNYKELKKFLSSYGEKFLQSEVVKKNKKEVGYLNPATQLVHTYFKQCFTDTGRLASGNVDEGFYNCQNIPKKKEIREGFGLTEEEIAAGYYLTTCDLSGAEATIMAAFADEQYMYELAIVKDDVHSPIATDCWRAVAAYREANGVDMTVKDSTHKKYILTTDFLIDKENNKGLRTDFKNFTFGTIYGMKDNKGATTLNIPKKEAQIMINVIRKKFPKIFKMVEEAEQCAFADGYVILNNRSNNRRWFMDVVDCHRSMEELDRTARFWKTKEMLKFPQIMEISGAARNVRIQGTQADMVKEAMVVLRNKLIQLTKTHDMGYVQWQYLPNRFGQQKLSVHDELVVKHKGKEFGTDVAQIMTETANKYLEPYSSNIRMKCEYHTQFTWTK